MVAIFTGAGAGFERGSANLLGGAGQLGSSLLGRAGESVSVNAATGNLLIARQDEFLIGRGPDIGISRSYNSIADTGDGDNGDNWQQSTTRRVFGLTGTLNTAGSTISRLGGDGSVIAYAWDAGASAYVTKDGAGAFDKLTHSGGVWTWTDGDSRITETYTADGSGNWRIATQADIDGNALTFTYAGSKLDKVTTADGSWTQYSWTGNAITAIVTGYTDLATSTAQTLTRVRYGYDSNGRLQTVTLDLSPGDNSVADGKTYVTTYTYEGSSNRVATIGQTDGSLLAITYDGQGRVSTLTQTVAGGVTRVTSLTYATGYTQVTGPDGQVTRLDYDGAGRLTKITAPPAVSGATAQEVGFAYDAHGNVQSVTDGKGKVTSYSHDANGNVTLVTDPNGNTVSRTYDAANRLITELRQGSDEGAASAAHYTQYAYDSEGHLRFAIDAAGQVTEYEYNAAGQLLQTIRYPEHRYPIDANPLSDTALEALAATLPDRSMLRIVENGYDARGNVVWTKAYGAADISGNPLTTEGVGTSYYSYDQAGNLLQRHNQGELAETFVYDGMGRLVASSDVHGGTTTILFNDASTTTTVTTELGYSTVSVFDKAGQLISQTDSGAHTSGGTATYLYDSSGRMRVATDASGRKIYIHYDHAGRKVAEVNHLGEIIEYRYDQANRLVATISRATALGAPALATLADPDNGVDLSTLLPAPNAQDVWSWNIYDDGGRLVQAIDNLGGTVVHEYDQSDRLIRSTAYATALSAGQLSTFKTASPTAPVLPAGNPADAVTRLFYDAAGQLVGTLDGAGYLTETVLDRTGLAIRQIAYATITPSGLRASGSFADLRNAVAGASASDRVSYSVYDGQGLLRYSINARGGITGFTYNEAGRLISTTSYATELTLTDFTYDAVKAAVVSNAQDRTNWTVYDDAGRIAYTVDAEGGIAAFAYDAEGRVTKSIAFDNLYTGAVTLTALNSWAANSAQSNDTKNRVTRNIYTERGELLYSIDAESFATKYTYDAEGRQLSRTAFGGNALTVGDATTIAQIDGMVNGAPTITVSTTYDNVGRILTITDGEGYITRNSYNALGQLVDVAVAHGTSAQVTTRYTYDQAGRILTQTSAYGTGDAATVTYAYDGLGNRTSVTDARGNIATYTYDHIGRLLTATDALGGATTYVYDAFDNVVKETDPKSNSTFYYYDRLNRLVTVRDAENFVRQTVYNRFGEAATVKAFANAFTDPPQIGVNPTGDPDAPYAGPSPAVLAAYAYAAQQQSEADAAAVALANEQGALSATLANPLSFLQTKLAERQAHLAYLQAQYNAANWFDKLFVWQPQISQTQTEINNINTNITRVQNNQGLNSWGTNYVNSAFNVASLQAQYNVEQAQADQALADAQALEAAEQNGNFGPYSGTTFTYDRLGRVVQKVDAEGYGETKTYNAFGQILTFRRYGGAPNSGSYAETSFEYDERGQLTKSTDAEGFFESYAYDAYGRRTGVAAKSSTTSKVAGGITTYTYDKRGLLLTETLPVQSYNSAGAALGAIVNSYSYDARGNLLSKTEATGDQFNYLYDAGGRLTKETRPSFDSQVAPSLDYFYDGLGNVVRTVQGSGYPAGMRVTQYKYGPGGRLTQVIDAEGASRNYVYDRAGRLVLEHYVRTVESMYSFDTVEEAIGYRYDIMGRNLGQGFYKKVSGSWVFQSANDSTNMEYNAFGDIKRSGINGLWQVENIYDAAGRVVATNAGDGIWKHFGYDRNGNQTIAITNAGASLTGKTFSQALAMVSQANVNATYTSYNARNLAIKVTEEGRQLSDTTTATLITERAYNAFGEVATETDALNNVTVYSYNTMGRRIRAESPTVKVLMEDGTELWIKPSEDFYYDVSGRLVATRDANGAYGSGGTANNGSSKSSNTGNLTTLELLAGTGYGEDKALVTKETHADGGMRTSSYDIHGDLLAQTDEMGRTIAENTYDKKGRLLTSVLLGGLTETYGYDELDRQTSRMNSFAGWDREITAYDVQGRVISKRSVGGDVTEYEYTWVPGISASGMGVTLGGWTKTTTYRNRINSDILVNTDNLDIYGRLTGKTNFEGQTHNYTYDLAGRLAKTYNNISGYAEINYSYYNTGLARGQIGNAPETLNKYDQLGRRTFESVRGYNPTSGQYEYLKQATATYDALGRLTQVVDQGGPEIPFAQIDIAYDANGNVIRKISQHARLNYLGNADGTVTETRWNRYDSMNRMVIVDGVLSGSQVVRGTDGRSSEIAYNVAGERTYVITSFKNESISWVGSQTQYTTGALTTQREDYDYDSAGRLYEVYVNESSISAKGQLRSRFQYNVLGLVTRQQDFVEGSTTNTVYDRQVSYGVAGQIGNEYISTRVKVNSNTFDTYVSNRMYDYIDIDGVYAMGNSTGYTSTNYKNGSNPAAPDTKLSYRFLFYDKATISQAIFTPNTSNPSVVHYNNYQIDPWGYTRGVEILDGQPRTVTIRHDENNQIISRREAGSATGKLRSIYYRFNGVELGEISNNGTQNVTYDASVHERETSAGSGPFALGSTVGRSHSDFNQHYDAINSYGQSSGGGGSYTVRAGDTLASIAQAVWGDAQLWYKIAEINGLGAGGALQAGQILRLPGNVVRVHHNASTYAPYDPGATLGDVSPTRPAPVHAKPPSKNGCGGLGAILLAVVAIAVTALLRVPITNLIAGQTAVQAAGAAGIAAGSAAGVAGAMGAAVAGSVVSQGIGVATGLQDSFSWKAVGLAALGGGIGAGLAPGGMFGKEGLFGGVGSGAVQSALRGATGSALSQGIAVATGIQSKFDWAGVAAAGVAASVGYTARRAFGAHSFAADNTFSNHLANLGASTAALMASAATRSAIAGTSFGDGIRAGLPDVIGQAISDALSHGVSVPQKQAAADHPVSAGGSSGFRSMGGQMEAAIKLPPLFAPPALSAKFGGQGNSLFNYSANFGPAKGQSLGEWALEGVAGAWDSGMEVIDGWVRNASDWDVGDIITVIGNKLEGGINAIKEDLSWRVDVAVKQATEGLGRNTALVGGNLVVPGLGYAFNSSLSSANAQAIGRGEVRGLIATTKSTLEGAKFLADLTSPNPMVQAQAGATLASGLTSLVRDPGQVVRAAKAEYSRVSALSGPARVEEIAYLATYAGAQAGTLAAGGTGVVNRAGAIAKAGRLTAAESVASRVVSSIDNVGSNSGLYRIGPYDEIRGTVPGLDAHHVGQKALMIRMIPNYDPLTAPAILVPKVGHTIRSLERGMVSRSTIGLETPRAVVARDIIELRRVYPDIPNAQLQQLIQSNKTMYPQSFIKGN